MQLLQLTSCTQQLLQQWLLLVGTFYFTITITTNGTRGLFPVTSMLFTLLVQFPWLQAANVTCCMHGNIKLSKVAVKTLPSMNMIRKRGLDKKIPCDRLNVRHGSRRVILLDTLCVTPSGKSSNHIWKPLGEEPKPTENPSKAVVLKIRFHLVTWQQLWNPLRHWRTIRVLAKLGRPGWNLFLSIFQLTLKLPDKINLLSSCTSSFWAKRKKQTKW